MSLCVPKDKNSKENQIDKWTQKLEALVHDIDCSEMHF